jgi:hypothetical protein
MSLQRRASIVSPASPRWMESPSVCGFAKARYSMNAKRTPLRCLVMVLAFLENAGAIGEENILACEPDPTPLLERQHDHMSRLIEATLRGADSLFSGNRSYDAPTGSYVQIIVSTLQQRARDGRSQYDLVPRAKINLPKTNERLQLFLEQDLPNTGRSEAQRDAQAAAGIQPHDLSEYLGLRGIAAEKLKLQLTVDGGVRMRVMPDLFARARARRVFTVAMVHSAVRDGPVSALR